MKAKDTVMNFKQMNLLRSTPAVAEAQAEISFKAGKKEGIWLYAWWKDGVQCVGTTGKTLVAAIKEIDYGS